MPNELAIRLVKPFAVNDTTLISSNVAETDYSVWSSATTYALGDYVIMTTGVHKVFKSTAASNLNNNPTTATDKWQFVSYTNRYKMFDTSTTSKTSVAGTISVVVRPGQVTTAVALLSITGASARIRVIDPVAGTVVDQTRSLAGVPQQSGLWYWLFGTRIAPTQFILTGLPPYPNADIYIDITGANASCGTCIIGQELMIGLGVQYGARVGIQDYSRNEEDEFGQSIFVVRNYASKASWDVLLEKAEADNAYNALASVRASPSLWIGTLDYEATAIFGTCKTFDIIYSWPGHAMLSMDLLGLT